MLFLQKGWVDTIIYLIRSTAMIKNVWIALYWNSNFWSLQCTICQPISSWCCVAAGDAAAVIEKYVVEAYVSIKDK